MVTKPAKLLQSKDIVGEPGPSKAEKLPVSATAMQLFEQMQDAGFADGAAKFMAMSPSEMGEAARKAVAVRKASR